ncbi:cytochrome c [Olivibacter sp. CPCC 100613]|uniref:c-type cytochrome n=1 Tax=Olivibacter sp. CPCC 100613 TaxID=3079931 RepID=UPI002FFA417C
MKLQIKWGMEKLLLISVPFVLAACTGSDSSTSQTVVANRKLSAASGQSSRQEVLVSPSDLMAKGVGPITDFKPAALDGKRQEKGAKLFAAKCAMCHQMDTKLIGPPLQGVTDRHTPEWVLNMLLAPDKMIAEDPAAKALYRSYQTPMINQQLTEEEGKAIYDYLRKN